MAVGLGWVGKGLSVLGWGDEVLIVALQMDVRRVCKRDVGCILTGREMSVVHCAMNDGVIWSTATERVRYLCFLIAQRSFILRGSVCSPSAHWLGKLRLMLC